MLRVTEVDREGVEPPYRQVASILRARIRSGQIPAGGRLPSITGLMQEYGIARTTAVKAVKLLVSEGYAETRPGWGTFARRPG